MDGDEAEDTCAVGLAGEEGPIAAGHVDADNGYGHGCAGGVDDAAGEGSGNLRGGGIAAKRARDTYTERDLRVAAIITPGKFQNAGDGAEAWVCLNYYCYLVVEAMFFCIDNCQPSPADGRRKTIVRRTGGYGIIETPGARG